MIAKTVRKIIKKKYKFFNNYKSILCQSGLYVIQNRVTRKKYNTEKNVKNYFKIP